MDAIAGGGGLIALPALLLAGLTPVEAIATNKLQGTFGVAASSYTFWRAGHSDLAALRLAIPAAAAGAAIGSILVGQLDPALLKILIPALLIVIAAYFAYPTRRAATGVSATDATGHIASPLTAAAIAFPVALYDGFLGPGAGSFYMVGLVAVAGLGLLPAVANTKVLNLTSNLVPLVIFMAMGSVVYTAGLPMAVAQLIGARLGAKSAIRHGGALIRPMIVIVTVLMALRLLYDALGSTGT